MSWLMSNKQVFSVKINFIVNIFRGILDCMISEFSYTWSTIFLLKMNWEYKI